MSAAPILTSLRDALAEQYAIERELGRGGMATVYLARDLRQDRWVALKVLHPELAHALGPERFVRETRLTARLQHPHILPVFDSGEARSKGSEGPGQLWYTMPYIAGDSLRVRLNREKHLAVDDAVRIGLQVLTALDYAHGQGVVHRDIKPENILLQGDQAVVADFGLARSISRAGADKLTETGISVGTPAYMSPEQAMGEGELDGRSDLYSVGCVLYEMLAGQPPFTGRSAQQILARHAVDPVPSLSTVRQTVPPSLEHAIIRALAKVPADRFRTAVAFSEALSAPAGGDPGQRRSARLPSFLRTRPSLRRALLAAAALVGVGAAGVSLSRSHTPLTLDPNLFAVAPFDVLDPKLEHWREGLVDYLTKNLDGAGQMHAVAPAVVLRRWKGNADAGSARSLGRRSGARVVIFGNLAPAGRDSVRVQATVLDAASGASVAEFEGLDQFDRVDRLADSLTLQVLRGLGRMATGSPARLTAVGTHSIPALKAYLKGNQAFRRAAYDSADAHYSRAIALDSTFALALHALATTRGWGGGGENFDLQMRAARFNQGLSPRDSLLILADSLRAAASVPDTAYWSHQIRMLEIADAAASNNREDPEPALMNADLLFHYDHVLGSTWMGSYYTSRSPSKVLRAFDRAIELDSAFAPAYVHPIELAGDPARAGPYIDGYLKAVGPNGGSTGIRLLAKLIDPAGVAMGPLDSIPTGDLGEVVNLTDTWQDSAEIALRLAPFYSVRPDVAEGPDVPELRSAALSRWRKGWLAGMLAYRGHLKAARAELGDETRSALGNEMGETFADLGLLGAIAADSVSAVAAASSSDPRVPTAIWWASRRDTSRLRAVLVRADSGARTARLPIDCKVADCEWGNGLLPQDIAQIEALPKFLRAALSLAGADTADALRRLLALPDSVFAHGWWVRLLQFQLLAAAGRDREAARVFDRRVLPAMSPRWVLGVLERGNVAERRWRNEKEDGSTR